MCCPRDLLVEPMITSFRVTHNVNMFLHVFSSLPELLWPRENKQHKVPFIPTKCFIRKKLIFRLLILQSSSEHTYTAVFCACCVCSDEDCIE